VFRRGARIHVPRKMRFPLFVKIHGRGRIPRDRAGIVVEDAANV